MLNVQNITSKLASLPDQALQQYAALNKNDPYIMALAVSESNRRKQVRAAQQAQGMQEQPKVVDQALQGMAQPMPEDVGIGQLPAGEMEFAGGGILAFAQGDSIPGPRGPNESFAEYRKRLLELEKQKQKAEKAQEAVAREQERLKRLEGRGGPLIPASPFFDRVPLPNKDAEAAASVAPQVRQDPLRAQEAAAGIPDGSVVPPVVSGTPDMPNADAAGPAGPAAPAAPAATQFPTGIAQVAAPTAAAAAPVTMDYAGARAGLATLPEFAAVTDELSDLETAKKKAAQKGIDLATAGKTREEELQKELGEYGVGREKRLKEREEKLSKDEKSNYGLAFLEAGLAMMGGKDQNAFANISAGALQGLGSYKTGLAKLNDRKEKLFDAYDALEDARRSDKKDRFARMEAAQTRIDNAQLALENVSVDVLGKKVEMNETRRAALGKAIIDTANTEYSTKSQAAEGAANRATQVSTATAQLANQRAIAQYDAQTRRAIAEMPSSEQRMYESLGGGDLKKGMEIGAQIKAGKFDVRSAYSKYLEAFAGKTTLEKPMDFTSFAGMFATTSAPPKGSQILKNK